MSGPTSLLDRIDALAAWLAANDVSAEEIATRLGRVLASIEGSAVVEPEWPEWCRASVASQRLGTTRMVSVLAECVDDHPWVPTIAELEGRYGPASIEPRRTPEDGIRLRFTGPSTATASTRVRADLPYGDGREDTLVLATERPTGLGIHVEVRG